MLWRASNRRGPRPFESISLSRTQQAGEHWEEQDGEVPPTNSTGTLRGRPPNIKKGDRLLTVFVEKWGFKEAFNFKEPQVALSVRGRNGDAVESVQVWGGMERLDLAMERVAFQPSRRTRELCIFLATCPVLNLLWNLFQETPFGKRQGNYVIFENHIHLQASDVV